MLLNNKIWQFNKANTKQIESLKKITGFRYEICQILFNRGYKDISAVNKFIKCSLKDLHDPFELYDMHKVVTRIIKAINNTEKIVIYGDYDADGITATVLLVKILRFFDAQVDFYIPDRQSEGYGLNIYALNFVEDVMKAKLIITVDCGISASEELKKWKKNIDVIITDHHKPPEILPKSFAIINPKIISCTSKFKHLSGVGIALKLAQGICSYYNSHQWKKFLDITAIGTVADMAPLVDENRIIVKYGLKQMKKTSNLGIKALLKVCSLSNKKEYDTKDIGYYLAPRINVAGRLKHAKLAMELLLSDNYKQALLIAKDLNDINKERKNYEQNIFENAIEKIEKSDIKNDKVIVLASNWHQGILGIVASRLVEKYNKTVILISINNNIGKGSCRSIKNFNIFTALTRCKNIILKYGGHEYAAGLTIDCAKIDELRVKLNKIASLELSDVDYIPTYNIDCILEAGNIDCDFLKELKMLEPFGEKNSKPIFVTRNLDLKNKETLKYVGKNKAHLQINFKIKNNNFYCIYWNVQKKYLLKYTSSISCAYILEYLEWNNIKRPKLIIYDLIIEEQLLARNELILIYSMLRNIAGGKKEISFNKNELIKIGSSENINLSYLGIMIGLTIFEQIGLIKINKIERECQIIFSNTNTNKKFNLSNSILYKIIKKQKELFTCVDNIF